MPDFLVFQLYGMLAAWGDIAVGEHRPSLGHPGQSAITGLLAAALGIKRNDEVQQSRLDCAYGMAVCVRAAGELLRDYHTVQVPGGKRAYASRRDELLLDRQNLHTILSQRDYRTDAFYQVAVWCQSEGVPHTLTALQQALQKPRFHLYLGRKSCPVGLPLLPVVMSGVTLKQAFDQYPLDQAKVWSDGSGMDALSRYYWDPDDLDDRYLGMVSSMRYPRRDRVGNRQRWQFASREECYYAESMATDQEVT